MIFCVEDDGNIRELMVYMLHAAGFEAAGFESGESFWKAVDAQRPELVILDIMLPGEDGLTLLKKLRTRSDTAAVPVILATAKGTEYDKVVGLDMGADDYLVKPFGMMEMVSRVRAVLRRTEPQRTQKTLRAGKLTLNLDTYVVQVDGERVQLTLKEYKLLRIFMENPGRVFTRERMLEMVWEVDYIGETRTVDVHIGTLRTKLGDCADYIKTVRGVGYCMEVPA